MNESQDEVRAFYQDYDLDRAFQSLYSDEEMKAIDELCVQMELTRTQILRQALRTYQFVTKGHAVLTFENKLPLKKPFENDDVAASARSRQRLREKLKQKESKEEYKSFIPRVGDGSSLDEIARAAKDWG